MFYEQLKLKLLTQVKGIKTPAGRLAMVNQLLHPVSDTGEELTPLITKEQAMLLLNENGNILK